MNNSLKPDILKISLKYRLAGLSIIPVDIKSKAPRISWKEYQSAIADESLIRQWFASPDAAPALVCGAVSGNVEIIDIDNKFADAEQLYQDFCELVEGVAPGLIKQLTVESTQSGGLHIIYRSPDKIANNLKLAERWSDTENRAIALFETRGEGGYAIVAPAAGYNIIQGKISELPVLTAEERDLLIDCALSFNEYERTAQQDESHISNALEGKPGDEYNKRGDPLGLLQSHGWQLFNQGDKTMLRRPGKDRGFSATFNYNKLKHPNRLYVFSSNAYPFEPNKSYDPFAVYALLEHKGDFSAAAKTLFNQGFGTMTQAKNGRKAMPDSGNGKAETATKTSKSSDRKNIKALQIKEWLRNESGISFRFNTVLSRYELLEPESQWRFLTDRDVNEIWCRMSEDGYDCAVDSLTKVIESEFSPPFNPIVEYFEKLPDYDDVDYIQQFADKIPVRDEFRDTWLRYLVKWLVATYECVCFNKPNHSCLILQSEMQGIGKTTIFGELVPEELKQYYALSQNFNPLDKDSKLLLTERMIINLDEMETSTGKEVGHLKSLITIKDITLRKPYAHYANQYPRIASFCGSINKHDFLIDTTGSRRFLVVGVVGAIDIKKPFNVNGLWSQVKMLSQRGLQSYFDLQEIALIEDENEKYRIRTPEEELIMGYYVPVADESEPGAYYLTATEILCKLSEASNLKLNSNNVGKALSKMNFIRKAKKNNKQVAYKWLLRNTISDGFKNTLDLGQNEAF